MRMGHHSPLQSLSSAQCSTQCLVLFNSSPRILDLTRSSQAFSPCLLKRLSMMSGITSYGCMFCWVLCSGIFGVFKQLLWLWIHLPSNISFTWPADANFFCFSSKLNGHSLCFYLQSHTSLVFDLLLSNTRTSLSELIQPWIFTYHSEADGTLPGAPTLHC